MKINNAAPTLNQCLIGKNNDKNVSFSGAGVSSLYQKSENVLKDFFELTRKGTLSRNLFIANAYVFLLGSRLITSRDNNERRETLTRDIPTFFVAVQALPIIKTWVSKQIQEKTGFALFENIKTSKDAAKSSQLEDWYHYNPNMKSGFNGFLERLGERGNLKKICSVLGEDIKAKLVNFSDKNDEFKTKLLKDTTLKQTLENAFKNGKNKALAKAAWLKTIPAILGFGLTLSLIGIFIPKFNIFFTEKINKNKKSSDTDSQK